MNGIKSKWMQTLLCASLLSSLLVLPVTAEEAAPVDAEQQSAPQQVDKENETLQPQKLDEVSIRANVSAEINNLVLIPSDNGQMVGFTLTVHNNSNTELSFLDYWVELASKDGATFSINTTSPDLDAISAKSTKDIIFYSQVGKDVSLEDLVVRVVEWDFSNTSTFTKVLGTITVPEGYSPVTAEGFNRVISADNTRLAIGLDRVHIGQSEKYYRPNLKLTITNEGKQSTVLPDYSFAIITEAGLLYPLTSSSLQGTKLNPLAEEEFRLNASIPIEVESEGWKLAAVLPVNEGASQIPLALFDLPSETVDQADDLGVFYTFSTADGVYDVRLDSINRLPIEDQDLIVANMTVRNNSTDTIPVPALTGEYTFNDNLEISSKVSGNNKIISLAPGDTTNIQAVSSIPYTTSVSKVNLVLQLLDNDGQQQDTLDLVEFTYNGEFHEIPVVNAQETYVIDDLGYRSEVSIRELMTFEGKTANIVAAQLNVLNMEKRLAEVQSLAGYFEAEDGSVYQATIEQLEHKLSPNGKAVMYAWTSVPRTLQASDMKLVLGKAVQEASGEEGQSQLIGYVEPHIFQMPEEEEPQNNMQSIDMYPYTLSIDNIATQIRYEQDTIILDLDYTLDQDLLAKTNFEDQKVIIELVDHGKKSKFSREYAIAGVGQEGGSHILEIGENTLRDQWTDEKLVLNIQTLKEFDFNIYTEIQPGYKKLIATTEIPWLVNRSLD
mgnify:CR=1 FL=1